MSDNIVTGILDKGDRPVFTANDWNCLFFGSTKRLCTSPNDKVRVSSYESGEINQYDVSGDNWVGFENKNNLNSTKDAYNKLKQYGDPIIYTSFEGDKFYAFVMDRGDK
jgi:hypothetical protein